MNIFHKIFIFSLVLTFIFSSFNPVFASDPYFEDFNSNDYSQTGSRWVIYPNGGNLDLLNGWLRFSPSNAYTFPYIYSDISDLLINNSFIEFKIRYLSGNITQGAGAIFSFEAAPNEFTGSDTRTNFTMGIWPFGNGALHTISQICPITYPECFGFQSFTTTQIHDNSDHVVRVERTDHNYKLFLDSHQEMESVDTNEMLRYIWMGNPRRTITSQGWPSFEIDYVRAGLLDSVNSPDKIAMVVVPGFGASWNYQEMFSPMISDSWHIPSFVTTYENLINSLVNAGYEKNVNLFVFPYDWRKGIDNLSDDLKDFINLKLAGEEKINLIGHSYGGLVARGYAQKWGTGKVNKLIEAGSPNYGLIDAYGAWEGGEGWSNQWHLNTAFSSLVELNRMFGESKVAATRRLVPSLRDLLPTTDYLLNSGSVVPISSMSWRNEGLPLLNTNSSAVDSFMTNLSGSGQLTKEKINVITPSVAESLVGKWQDGKPDPTNRFVKVLTGDDTVTTFSSKGNLTKQILINASHGGIISSSDAIEAIFGELGLDTSKVIATTPIDGRSKSMVIALRSPGSLHVCTSSMICDESLGIMPNNKLFIWPDYEPQSLSVRVEANGEMGTYRLAVGEIAEESEWKEIVGRLTGPTQINHYTVDTRTGEPSISQPDGESIATIDQSIAALSVFIPSWDNKNYMATINNTGLSPITRLYAARQLRERLADLMAEKVLQSDQPATMSIRLVWDGLDLVAKGLALQVSAINSNQLSSRETLVNSYRTFGASLITATSSFSSGDYFLKSGEDVENEAGAKLIDRDWAYEVLENARLNLLISLKVR